MDLRELGRCPVSDASPAGTEPRQSADYERLLEEIGKLGSLQGAAAVDWNVVADSAVAVLERQAKDIPAAVYLSVGLTQTNGIQGLADSVRILADLLAGWWDVCFPPLKRLRARANMLGWWRERIAPLLDAPRDPVDPALRDDLLVSLRELDATLGEVLPDMPPLRDLLERVERLNVTEAAPEPAPASDESAPPPAEEAPAAPSQAAPAPEAPQPSQPPAARPSAPLPQTDPPADEQEAIAAFLAAARNCAAMAFARQIPENGAAWAALYVALWGRIEKLPPAENQTTALPPPPEEELAACRNLLNAGRAAEAALALARLLPACPFCLDAQRLLFSALTRCERPLDAALVLRESRALAARLPGLTALTFADGRPFADAETRSWLQQEDAAAPAPAAATAGDDAEALRSRARETAAGGNLAAALDILEDARRRCGASSAAAFALRVEQLRLLTLAGLARAAAPLAEELERVARERGLADWQPELCLDALRACHAAWSLLDTPDARRRADDCAAAVCLLRPSNSPFL